MKKSFEEYNPESTEEELKQKGTDNTDNTDPTLIKKTLSRQVATEIVPQVVASIIYEESSDSDQNRVISQFRNQKRIGKKIRNQRSNLLHGMRIDSIEDHEGSSSPPYDDTRASESAPSMNDFYIGNDHYSIIQTPYEEAQGSSYEETQRSPVEVVPVSSSLSTSTTQLAV